MSEIKEFIKFCEKQKIKEEDKPKKRVYNWGEGTRELRRKSAKEKQKIRIRSSEIRYKEKKLNMFPNLYSKCNACYFIYSKKIYDICPKCHPEKKRKSMFVFMNFHKE